MGVSISTFDSLAVAESVDLRPFRGRAVFSHYPMGFGHRPFTQQGFSIYIQKTSDPDLVQDRYYRCVAGSFFASMGDRQLDFAADNIKKTAYHTLLAFPLLNLDIPFEAGDEGDWWVMALPHGLDIETPRHTTGFECMKPLRLTLADGDIVEDGKLPNAPRLMVAEVRAFGILRLHWFYDRSGEQATPSIFRIFHNNGSESLDYTLIRSSVNYVLGQFAYYVEFSFPHKTTVTFGVRAETAAGDRETNTNTITGTADKQGPPDAENLLAFGQCRED